MKKNIISIFKKRRKVIGLYIGQDTVDMVILKATLKGPKLVKFAQSPIYPNKEVLERGTALEKNSDKVTGENSEVKTQDDYIIKAIQRVFKENNVKPKFVVTAVPSEDVMVRYFQMPKIPQNEWDSAINFEAKRYIPFHMEDLAVDYHVVERKSLPIGMDVVFVAVKSNVLERYVNIFEKSGVKPSIVEPAPFSLIRVLKTANEISDKMNVTIVKIDSAVANIIILRKGVPYLIRNIPINGKTYSDETVEPIFEKLLMEIKLSFDFYEKQFPSEVIDKIVIYSNIPLENWNELVAKEFDVPVEIGDPLRGIIIGKNVVSTAVAAAFGLALRGIADPFIEVNLLKDRISLKGRESFLKMLFLEASVAVFLLIILKVVCMRLIVPLTNELNRTLSERPREGINITVNKIDELERITSKLDKKKELIENIISNRTYFADRMLDIAEVVPDNIWLSEVEFMETPDKKDYSKVDRELRIKGYCIVMGEEIVEANIINNFLSALKERETTMKGMKNVDIISLKKIDFKGEKVVSFEILFSGAGK